MLLNMQNLWLHYGIVVVGPRNMHFKSPPPYDFLFGSGGWEGFLDHTLRNSGFMEYREIRLNANSGLTNYLAF